MYVYRTPEFNIQAEKRGILNHVERLCADLEGLRLDEVQSRFERVYPYLKRKEGNLRLIARIRRIGNDYILCWLKIFRRGDHEYEFFLRSRENFANHILEKALDTHLTQWLTTEKQRNKNQHYSLFPLDQNLQIWLKRPDWEIDSNSSIIYESQYWFTRFSEEEIQHDWQNYINLITDIAETKHKQEIETDWPQVRLYGYQDKYLLFSRLITDDNLPRQVLFLIAPLNKYPSQAEIAHILDDVATEENDAQILRKASNNRAKRLTLNILTSLAKRAYPSYFLADENLWLAIENDEGINLALSAEEEEILHSVSTNSPSLPLFLNGRAGSGKSTLLFHLFADYCHRHLQYCQEKGINIFAKPHPLFLAYNQSVTDLAKGRVMSLLESHHRFLSRRGQGKTVPNLSRFFQPFRPFLKGLLPPKERKKFKESNYISFYQFRQLCRQAWRGYSPEKCWLVIRNFIKGYHLDERDNYPNVEDYQEIPKKERSVSIEDFQDIYNKVWKWYDNYTQSTGKWDDQDLIRRVLQLKCYHSHYTVIFCDESQDFTQLELQLILKISVFYRYDLEHQYIESLPFAFAGDPLQTLHPTGFRWDSLKAAFYNQVLTTLAPTGKLDIEMNFAELKYNYRSIAPIVGFSNLVQLWRKNLFNVSEINPQLSLKKGIFKPEKFILDKTINKESLKLYLQDTIIIVPCDEGEEKDFIIGDELLSYCLDYKHYQEKCWNVISAISAKGLEFTQVILYKFGHYSPNYILNYNSEPKEEHQYFFNKLYVAVSRATNRLFILDTQQGDFKFWQQANNPENIEKILNKIKSPLEKSKWQQHIQLLTNGKQLEVLSSQDLELMAKSFEMEGFNTENPDLLRRAQGAYNRSGNHLKAAFCEAWALKMERKWLEAGNAFFQQGKIAEAWDCLRQGMSWENLKWNI